MNLVLDEPAWEARNQYTSESMDPSAESQSLHVAWVNQHAALIGGAEQYIFNTAKLLREQGVRNTLIYDVAGEISPEFTSSFDFVHPLVDPQRQLNEIAPDVIFAHRIDGCGLVREIAHCEAPSIRFFHDHKLFCLREHKYTTLGSQTCTRATGLGCYGCLGFLGRSEAWPGVRLASLANLHREQQANREFDAFAVGSDYMAEHIREHGFAADRIHTLPLFAMPPAIDASLQTKPKRFLFAGALVRGKGLDVLLEALARMRSTVQLVVAGAGRQEAAYRAQATRLGLAHRVEFMGRLDRAEMAAELQKATCLVAPSRSPETFGLSGLEALSYGTPVIASQVGGMGMWLRHNHTGLFFPSGDAAALASAMDRMVEEEALAQRLGSAGRQLYLDDFTPANHLDSLLAMFHRVIACET